MNANYQKAFSDLGWGNGKETLSLLQQGLNPDIKNDLNEPLILAAARSGNWLVFEASIKAGANPDAETPAGHKAYHYAVAGSLRENYRYWPLRCSVAARKIVQWYYKRGFNADVDKVMFGLAMNRIKAFSRAIAEGADVNARFADPSRALLPYGSIDAARIMGIDLAQKMGLTEIEKRFQNLRDEDGSAQPSVNALDVFGDPTLLMWTHAFGRTDYSAILLAKGADVSLRDSLGHTCQAYAVMNRKPFAQVKP